jgi:DNA-binding GntR family transcriptional regulator
MSGKALASLKLPKRASLGTMVADSIRDAIYTGQFHPGQRLGQIMVAQALGVSQTTVRDAFATLEREGLVQRSLKRGAVVIELSPADIEEIITLRTTLEIMAVRSVVHSITPEQIAALEQNIRAMQASQGPAQLAALDLEFHESLVRFADHKRLLAGWQALLGQLKILVVHHKMHNRHSLQSTTTDHRALLALLQAGDEAGAVAHIERQVAVYRVQLLNEKEPRPQSRRGQ